MRWQSRFAKQFLLGGLPFGNEIQAAKRLMVDHSPSASHTCLGTRTLPFSDHFSSMTAQETSVLTLACTRRSA